MAMNLVGLQQLVDEFARQFNDPTYRFSGMNYVNGPWGCTCAILSSPPPNPPSTPPPQPNAYVDSITINPANFMVTLGGTQQMVATAVYSDQSTVDVTKLVVWTVDLPTVATIDSNGLLTGQTNDAAYVYATMPTAGEGGTQVQGSTAMYVTAPPAGRKAPAPADVGNPSPPIPSTWADNCGYYTLIGPINESAPLADQIAPYVAMLRQMISIYS